MSTLIFAFKHRLFVLICMTTFGCEFFVNYVYTYPNNFHLHGVTS